ncbi:MAG TPA: hypothetical protein PL124_03095 [Candidatus Cloacimonadota bacterium]|nr:hypothetical protein [Candidatus Cloacimonadota bacterium]HPS38379.1 hypothetical protein [Candidatus Cloacimonadota bacterium]
MPPGLGLGLGLNLGSGGGVGSPYSAEAQAYFSRVGMAKVANPVFAAALIDNIVGMGLYSNCLLYADISTGMETRVAGADTFITKIYDMSVKANDVLNTTETQQPKLTATGGIFDGSNDLLSCAGSDVAFPVTKKLTLFSWVNFTNTGLTYPRILACEGKWSIVGDGTTGKIRWLGTGLDTSLGTVDSRNTNVFVAITYDGDVGSININLYVNGGLTPDGYSKITGGGNLTAVGTTPVTIGNRAVGDRQLAGIVNHCGIFNAVLTPAQLKSIFDLTKSTYGVA